MKPFSVLRAVPSKPTLFVGLMGTALILGGALMPAGASAQSAQPVRGANGQPATAPLKQIARRAPAATAAGTAAASAAAPVVAAADDAQHLAMREVMIGSKGCEFGQSIQVAPSARHPGYVDLSFKNRTYLMKPVMSPTGALRLEDVRSEALLIQIGNKTMLMNQKSGQRMVDNCIHANQRNAPVAAGSGMLGIENSK